jgi:hypothetical protein
MNTILLPQNGTTLHKLLSNYESATNIAPFIIVGFHAYKKGNNIMLSS